MNKPKIGISIGDPAGIGPEIIAKALGSDEVLRLCQPQVVATPEYSLLKDTILAGRAQVQGGKIAVESFLEAIRLALAGQLDAVVTAPLNKEAMHLAGYNYNGHTEILAEQTKCKKYGMLFYSQPLKVILTTIHCPLSAVPQLMTTEKLNTAIELGYQAMLDFGIVSPRLGIAGLNPHAGEQGLFGNEDLEIISPAVERYRQRGWQVEGPLPPDTAFLSARQGRFDLVVAQYHDQGLIPLKLLAFDSAVNITVGTPVIRTSVDHGTAYNIAGQGIANPGSLIEAIKAAVLLVNNRKASA
ncbi:4-hydroxythreonine-4-phosphate dehydrogenase PdxA [Candidatus Margulisiibacteriota bacterium]